MFCPKCGKEITKDNANFCSHCGHNLHSSSGSTCRTEPPQFVYQQPRKKSNNIYLIAALSIIICALLVFTVCFSFLYAQQEEDPDNQNTFPTDDYIIIEGSPSETALIKATGDFANGTLSAEFNKEGYLIITLSDTAAANYSIFNWTLTDLHHTAYTTSYGWYHKYVGTSLNKTEPVYTWITPAAGEYEFSVVCADPYKTGSVTYSGKILYDDYLSKNYSWAYDGHLYNMEINYKFTEYLEYSNSAIPDKLRTGADPSKIIEFCVINDTLQKMADGLAQLYQKTYGATASLTDQNFAEFILAFVNICYEYPPSNDPDTYVYGQGEYWAYPMETIYHGMGDCEDTAILCASLFKASGYQSAVVLLPKHAIAAVALDEFTESYINPSYHVSLFYQIIDGKTYYGCETTLDTNTFGIGYINSAYSYSGGYIVYNGKLYKGDYGFYPLSS